MSSSKLVLATWVDRFFAWLIDFAIILLVVLPTLFVIEMFGTFDETFWQSSAPSIFNIVLFAYWIILEYHTGKTIGKKILNLQVIGLDGKRPPLRGVVIGSFGKAFLLPVDVVLGWIFTDKHRQRIFNKLGDTLVIKIKENIAIQESEYLKD